MDANGIIADCTGWIRSFFAENGKDSPAVVGISGGKDSSVAAALCVRALGRERVIGVLMPDGVQPDIDCARLLVSHLGIENYEINIRPATDAVKASLPDAVRLTGQAAINLPPRIRMATLYAVSQCRNGRVVNTCNLSEDYVGYSTRYGDAAGDFAPLANLTAGEVIEIGRALGLPRKLTEKAPSDGLTGRTDEDNLGFTYRTLDRYIRTGEIDDGAVREKIDLRHRNNLFKLKPMPSFMPEREKIFG